jgi:hypothetical protein
VSRRAQWSKDLEALVAKPWRSVQRVHKYRAKRTVVDGITFASQKEARRYQDLKLLMRAGDVRNLKLQPRYTLCPLVIENADARDVNAGFASTRRFSLCQYVADFEYEQSDRGHGGVSWRLVVEDVKGMKTDVYKLKRKWFEAQYGITILET